MSKIIWSGVCRGCAATIAAVVDADTDEVRADIGDMVRRNLVIVKTRGKTVMLNNCQCQPILKDETK